MNVKTSRTPKNNFCFCLAVLLSFSPLAFAQQKIDPQEPEQEASTAQAQATMASLFGRGAKMPGIPRMSGTIALPSFDSSGMTIDEDALSAAQRGEQNA